MKKPVIIFGAGATAACGGPTTDQILPRAFAGFYGNRPATFTREDFFKVVENFLIATFNLPRDNRARTPQHYPAVPLLLSLIDTAIDRQQPFAGHSLDDLRKVRSSLEYLIFAVLFEALRTTPEHNPYQLMLAAFHDQGIEPAVISLNYDVIADNVLFALAISRGGSQQSLNPGRARYRLPNYCCDIRTRAYSDRPHDFGLLLKLHGSLNWIYCPNCHRLDIGLVEAGPTEIYTRKVLDDLYREVKLHDKYSCQGTKCLDCTFDTRPVLITPTHRKDYRNPHIAKVWYEAERLLRQADRVFIVGYSLPPDDVEVIYLLKRGLQHLVSSSPELITIIQHSDTKTISDSELGLRYRSLFSDRCDWQPAGFGSWVSNWMKEFPQGTRRNKHARRRKG